MTEFKLRVRALVIAIGFAVMVGIGGGLFFGWIVWPVQITNVDLADLKTVAQDDYILLVAKTFAYDQDVEQARARLALLNKARVEDYVAARAQKYRADDPDAGYLANLARALGSREVKIAQIVATSILPSQIAETATLVFSESPTLAPTITPTYTITTAITSSPARTATRTRTPAPRATATTKPPVAQPVGGTVWLPTFPAEWPNGVQFQNANVSPGQKYWHLAQALYCDLRDMRFDCGNKPGGVDGIGIYVSLIGGIAPLLLNGSPANLEDKSLDAQCQCTYSLDFPNGQSIKIGNFPSDTISGLALNSVKTQIPQTHVRYFLTFQLVTR